MQSVTDHRAFAEIAAQGRAGLAAVQIDRDRGAGHVAGPIAYDRDFPTSGPHSPTWTIPGVYDRPQPKSELVHALEHGHIVVYYSQPSPEAWRQLTDWADLFTGKWDGLVLTPYRGLDQSLVMTAWNRTLRLDAWDGAVAAAFIDAYRGRGPENPVR